jgi:DNA excision repair protein ERCC-6
MERGSESLTQNERPKGEQPTYSSPVSSATPAIEGQAPAAGADETSRLRELQADIRDQDDLERDITRQVYYCHAP